MTPPESAPVPVAIIGMGCLFPQAEDLSAYWSNIVAGVDAITEVPSSHWRPDDYFHADPKKPDHTYAHRGGFLSPVPFPPLEFGITPHSLEATDTTQLLGLLVAKKALEHAGYGADRNFDRNRVSVILGVTGTLPLVIPLGARLGHPIWKQALREAGVDETTAADVMQRIADGYVGWQEESFPGLLGNVVAGRIANKLDLGGTNCVVDAACASSLSAIHLALLELSAGRCDMVLTGGMDTFNDIFMYMCFSKTPALSPTGAARPFSTKGDGTILGEGLGCLLLKRLPDAERDGDTIYAVLRSIGTSSDGKGQAIYAPSPAGQTKALRQAYRLADVTADTIELVEAHGTGTRAGDAAEVAALTEVYREAQADGTWCALGSVKSQIGHTKAAAGAAGLLKAALALHHKVLPPTIKVEQPIEALQPGQSPFYVNVEKRPWLPDPTHPRRAAVSAFGFGGSNFHCVLEEYRSQKQQIHWDGQVQIVALSAPNREELQRKITATLTPRDWTELRRLAVQSRTAFRAEHPHRLTLMLTAQTDIARLKAQIDGMWARGEAQSTWSLPDGVYYSSGPLSGKLGLLFPGQGSQYAGMLRDLACQFPQMLDTLAEANTVFAGEASTQRLSDLIYPLPVFTDEDRKNQEAQLRATNNAQPALGAVSLGAWRVLQYFGVQAAAVAGHSFGELTALCAAERLSAVELHRLACRRGRHMAAASGGQGGMLAVQTGATDVAEVLRSTGLNLVIANHNAPAQTVISGRSDEIERAVSLFSARGLTVHRLPVGAAFHSPLVAAAAAAFRADVNEVNLPAGTVDVFANTTGQPYSIDASAARELLAQQLARPVAFVDLIENMYAAGIRTFVETGPGHKLAGLVRSILGSKPHHVCSVDGSQGKQSGAVDLARVLAQLAALGHDMELSRWEPAPESNEPARPKKTTLTVPLCGANHVAPRPSRPPVPSKESKPEPTMSHSNGHTAKQPHSNGIKETPKAPEVAPVAIRTAAPEQPKVNLPATIVPAARPAAEAVQQSLRFTQDSLQALQRLTEQTSQLHRQFLDGQDRALQVFQQLLAQQQQAYTGMSTPLPAPVSTASVTVHAVSPATQVPAPAPIAPPKPQPAPQPVAAASAPQTAPVSAPASAAPSQAMSVLLNVVAEKTGYPAEMLELSMELDADLGIDSIKRVEIFSALQERLPNAPAIQAEHIGNLRTLADVAAFLAPSGVDSVSPAAPIPQTTSTAAAPATSSSPILLAVVAEKTGYPAEMLELSMELDADLGIDSIKRVEIFSALQERLPNAPAIQAEHIGSLRTLGDVLAFLDAEEAAATVATAPLTVPAADWQADLLAVVAEKTGYPAEMLELSMELDADLGIDSIKRVEIFSALQERLPNAPTIQAEHIGGLRTLGDVLAFLQGTAAQLEATASVSRQNAPEPAEPAAPLQPLQRLVVVPEPLSHAEQRPPLPYPANGEFWLIGAAAELADLVRERLRLLGHAVQVLTPAEALAQSVSDQLCGVLLVAPQTTADEDLFHFFRLVQHVGPTLRRAAARGAAALMTVTQLGGTFGIQPNNIIADPLSGGLAGLVKTAAQEWPEVQCRAIDLAGTLDLEEAAAALTAEITTSGPLEVGLTNDGPCTLVLREEPQTSAGEIPLTSKDVVVVTGGARGVTAEVALALARSCQPTLLLLGRSPLPEAEPAWLAGLTEEQDIKRALLTQANGHGTPKLIGEQYQRLLAQRELRRNLEQLRQTGATVVYRSVDVRDGRAVAQTLTELRQQFGPITGLLHGAGVLADRRIEDKTEEQFRLVYETKVAGLRHLLTALDGDPLQVLAVFSSSTARFGRTGQVDYAIANEVLNKLAQQLAQRRPECRVVSCNWGPWAGGMVHEGLKTLFAKEGLTLIPLREGAEFLLREIRQPAAVEVVVLGAGSQLPLPVTAPAAIPDMAAAETPALALAFRRAVSVAELPVLTAHVLGGRAVLPVALIVEWLAHAALHTNPGLAFHGLDDLKVLKGVKLHEDQTITLEVLAGKASKQADGFAVPVELRETTAAGVSILHARAVVRLAQKLPAAHAADPLPGTQPLHLSPAEIYEKVLFHGPDFQGLQGDIGLAPESAVTLVSAAPAPPRWIRQPLRQNWLAEPLALDCAFQLLVLWCVEYHGVPSLPIGLGQYRQFRRNFPRQVQIVARVVQQSFQRVTADIDWLAEDGSVVARLVGYECIMDGSLTQSFRRNRLRCEAVPSR